MLPQLITTANASLSNKADLNNELSTEINLNYNKSVLERKKGVTIINIDKAIRGKGDVANTKTYLQNIIKKYELTGNKEVCIRKIFIAEREDNLFDITIRESKLYYRKEKKQQFNKVIRFKSPIGTIEYIFDLLKNKDQIKDIASQNNYLLN